MRAPKSIISEQTRLQYRVFALLADEIPLKAVANIWPALVQDIERPQNPLRPDPFVIQREKLDHKKLKNTWTQPRPRQVL